jgi:prepilin-type N-terminal cleavage/methylation domain-containing protein
MRGRQGGYTVIELMIVLAIMGLLAAVVVTTWETVSESLGISGAKGAAEELAEAVRSTRQRAITGASNFCIQSAVSLKGYEILDVGTGFTCSGGTVVSGPTEMVHSGLAAAAWSFIFTPVSTAVDSGGNLIGATSVTVDAAGTPSGQGKKVCVNGAGAVTVLNPGGTCA